MTLREAQHLANELLTKHGLAAKGWTFAWDNRSIMKFGVCRYRTRQILLSSKLAKLNPQEIEDTIRHEIGHAMCPGAGHGPVWKAFAGVVGYKPERCKRMSELVMPRTRFEGVCRDCGVRIAQTRKPSPVMLRGGRHTACRYKLNGGAIRWSENGQELDRNGNVITRTVLAEAASTVKTEISEVDIRAMWERLNKLERKL